MARTNRTLREGLMLGGLAYAAVAVFYAVFDFLAARGPLYTVDLLGKALFRGLRDPSVLQLPIRVDFTAIFIYNALHLVASLAIGWIIARLIERAEHGTRDAYLSLTVIVAGFVVTVVVVHGLTDSIRSLLPTWSILAANGVATLVAGGVLVWKRPEVVGLLLPFLGRPSTLRTGGATEASISHH
ncbi:MAG: hypothetical protein Q8N53_12820 [Longimicrobiales bacterium]|nr:hypothetical protein [Longimicrobiales bacterium]